MLWMLIVCPQFLIRVSRFLGFGLRRHSLVFGSLMMQGCERSRLSNDPMPRQVVSYVSRIFDDASMRFN